MERFLKNMNLKNLFVSDLGKKDYTYSVRIEGGFLK